MMLDVKEAKKVKIKLDEKDSCSFLLSSDNKVLRIISYGLDELTIEIDLTEYRKTQLIELINRLAGHLDE